MLQRVSVVAKNIAHFEHPIRAREYAANLHQHRQMQWLVARSDSRLKVKTRMEDIFRCRSAAKRRLNGS